MIQNILCNLGGIQGYGLVSIGLFFLCFLGILVWVSRLKKPHLNAMAQKPLETDSEPKHAHE